MNTLADITSKSETKIPAKSAIDPAARAINQAFEDYLQASKDPVLKAVICGNLLNEKRQSMNVCQRDKRWDSPTKSDGEKFTLWLSENCPDISQRTAYRFMHAAEKILSHLKIEAVNGINVSKMLADPSIAARALVLEYISGKTMRACLTGVILEGDENSRLVRAQNGKHLGGTNALDNRRDYPRFIRENFSKINTIQGKWAKFMAKTPGEHSKMVASLRATILGGQLIVKTGNSEYPQDFEPWTKEFSKVMFDILRERLRADAE